MGKLGGIVVALVIAGVMVGLKYSNKSDSADEYREQVSMLLATIPDYAEAGDYYEGLCDVHHERVFEEHYTMGGRRSSSSFDADAYIHDLLKTMAADATRSGYEIQAAHLTELEQGVITVDEPG
ncbi:MAG: hypothetical protein AAGF47_10795 [Planctomycetota bacterium]